MIRLRYFASLRETLGFADEQLELPASVANVADLTCWLRKRGGDWDNAMADRRLHVAVNQAIATPEAHSGQPA